MIPVTKLNSQYGLFIDGAWRPSADGKTFDSFCPATGDKLASCAEATSQDVDAAVDAAWKAFATWKKTTVKERATLLNKIADIIDAHTDELALIETLDNGKPIRETKNIDVPLSATHFRYFAGCILAEEGSATMLDNTTMSIILREPIGVVGQIVPWNFPFLMAAWKLAPVLASGCCTVLKPSKTTSLSVLYFADLIKDILPPGVFNVITGASSKAGQYMLDHKGFCKLAFTGSTEVGLSVAKAAAEKLIPATLELGGKSANIFFSDCNLEQAYDGAQLGILFNQGQVCCAGSRIFVQEDIYDEFVAELVNRFNKVKIGLPWEEDTQLGATIYKAQLDKVLS
ncbi:aldehyde dehydrogenase family protein, partial [Mitsuokella jalaludinii]|uniref:aldehyde dehydrogenase family protein n=1 Tax=Mitsuokella jalaludinii TaxID=187979 RepID=UPI002A90F8C1